MQNEILAIRLMLPLRMGYVNCYLIDTGDGFVLIDTGPSNSHSEIARLLEEEGCKPGLLKLIVLTHGDFDHTGNAAYLRQRFGCKIAMHPDDAGMAERGDMFVNRKKPNLLIRKLLPALSGFGTEERFTPDVLLEDGDELLEYGLKARIISIPGHSKGSIGILVSFHPSLSSGQVLFCGDLLENTKTPVLNSLIDDLAAAKASLDRLRRLNIGMVYPGHGKPFPIDSFL